MIKPVENWLDDFDHLDPRWVKDPYAIWEDMRRRGPIAHTKRYGGAYFPSLYRDIRAIANDPEHFSPRSVVVRATPAPLFSNPPINSDPPEQTDHRRLLLAPFAPQAVKRLEPRTRAICRTLLDEFADSRLAMRLWIMRSTFPPASSPSCSVYPRRAAASTAAGFTNHSRPA